MNKQVKVAVIFTSLVITWVSLHSFGAFLRGELEQKFPELLERTSSRQDQAGVCRGTFPNDR